MGGKDVNFLVSASECVVTSRRMPATYTDEQIEKPGIARNAAVSIESPRGNINDVGSLDYTPLQQHVLFWDRNHDGQVYPYDTYTGFRDLGFNMIFSILSVLIINSSLSYPTRLAHSYVPDPFFRVYVDSIYKAKHGSDSGTYDTEGRFVPQSFEDMFSKYDQDHDGALTLRELLEMLYGNRCAVDPFGWAAALFEWVSTWLLLQKNGRIYREDLRGVYDGSIFWKIRAERKSSRGWSQGFGIGDFFKGG